LINAYFGGRAIDINRVSAVAEITSSVAILVTLIYLAVQTQQTNTALLAASRQASIQAETESLGGLIDHPEINVFLRTPIADSTVVVGEEPEYTAADYWRVDAWVTQYLKIREFAWFQFQNGVMDEVAFEAYMAPTGSILSRERAKTIWEGTAPTLDPGFVQYIRERVDGL